MEGEEGGRGGGRGGRKWCGWFRVEMDGCVEMCLRYNERVRMKGCVCEGGRRLRKRVDQAVDGLKSGYLRVEDEDGQEKRCFRGKQHMKGERWKDKENEV